LSSFKKAEGNWKHFEDEKKTVLYNISTFSIQECRITLEAKEGKNVFPRREKEKVIRFPHSLPT